MVLLYISRSQWCIIVDMIYANYRTEEMLYVSHNCLILVSNCTTQKPISHIYIPNLDIFGYVYD